MPNSVKLAVTHRNIHWVIISQLGEMSPWTERPCMANVTPDW